MSVNVRLSLGVGEARGGDDVPSLQAMRRDLSSTAMVAAQDDVEGRDWGGGQTIAVAGGGALVLAAHALRP